MKNYMAIYVGSTSAKAQWEALDDQERKKREQAGMDAWMKWATDNAKSIVDGGSPLGKTKEVSAGGVADRRNDIGAYAIVRAESHEAAARLFLHHPHFTLFPGEAVEVMECLPLPMR